MTDRIDFSFVEHIGLTVPNLDEAVAFFCDVFGASEVFRASRPPGGALMEEDYGAPRNASFKVSMLRLPPNLNVELFEWATSGDSRGAPRASDAGGHHLCLRVDDVERVAQQLSRLPGVNVLGRVKTVEPGRPAAGSRWVYFTTPWGLQMEVVSRNDVDGGSGLIGPASDRS